MSNDFEAAFHKAHDRRKAHVPLRVPASMKLQGEFHFDADAFKVSVEHALPELIRKAGG